MKRHDHRRPGRDGHPPTVDSALASLRDELEEQTAADTALREELQAAARTAQQAEQRLQPWQVGLSRRIRTWQ
ncbi:hypothetical protein [Streptomyces sp. AC627_RSS907]|uniref:hypothetical protein n=1 Tax=Streptomyces sp. AC627_RSS907 TaxID=2823684 RepID=UPI001C2459B3|nr:hypothetical protein [Streptomyces sp. AC627_RSS907]